MKVLRDAWTIATGICFAPLRGAEKEEIRTYIIKHALKRNFAFQRLSHLHGPGSISRYTDKRLRVQTPPMEERWNY
jgi:hypothetical protein